MTDKIARVWNGSSWEVITSTAAAPTAVANYQSTAPLSPATGQVWIDSGLSRQFYVWNGTSWVSAITTFSYQSTAPSGPTTGQVWIDSDDKQFYVWTGSAWISAITTYSYAPTAPSSPTTGQVWVNSTKNQMYIYTGSLWQPISTPSGSDGTISLNSNVISESYTLPVGYNGTSAGPITINDGVTITIPNGSEWTIL